MATTSELDNPVVFDIECYPNYFLVAFKRLGQKGVKAVETSTALTLEQRDDLRAFCARRTLIGYFSAGYDMIMLSAAMQGWPVKRLKILSDHIVTHNTPSWMIMKENGLHDVRCRMHIDLSNSLGWFASSLKTLACRIGYEVVWDLPYEPDTVLNEEDMLVVKRYCINDLGVTEAVYEWPAVKERIEQRLETVRTRDEPFDWMNGGDVRICEQMIKHRTGITSFDKISAPKTGRCRTPDWAKTGFDDFEIDDMVQFVNTHEFSCASGKVKLPPQLNRHVDLANCSFKYGIGGIHSTQKGVYAISGDYQVYDVDVSSYYPNLIIQLGIDPQKMKGRFKTIYPQILQERIEAKKKGDLTTASVMKLVANSVYGKMGSPYSIMYDPYALASVTFSGQFGMLLLVEYLHRVGVTVISSNTDSVTCAFPRSLYDEFRSTCEAWCEFTRLDLDYDELKGVYYRDINNYLRIYPDGSVKGKGIFMKPGPRKAPYPICITNAVTYKLRDDVPIEHTIRSTWDPNEFCHSRNIRAGAMFEDMPLGKSPRWVWEYGADSKIVYRTNGNKVPNSDGCKPLMDLRDEFNPDYDRYISAAYKLYANVTKTRIC